MGSQDDNNNNNNKTRSVLGDITNHQQSGGSGSGSKPGVGNKRAAETNTDDDDDDARFWKQVALVVENLEKDRSIKPNCPKVSTDNSTGLSPLKGGKKYRLQTSSTNEGRTRMDLPNVGPHQPKKAHLSVVDSIDLVEGEASAGSERVRVKESCGPSVMVARGSSLAGGKDGKGEESRAVSDVGENDCAQEGLACKGVVTSRGMESRDVGSFGLERCTALKGDGAGNLTAGLDLIKSCSCSFCTKASYIWSDLHYQDAKGRLSVLQKSQKEASNLAERYSRETVMERHGQGNATKVVHEGPDLTSQWKSLFLNMENTFAAESSQVEAKFLALKNLREEYRTFLGTTDTDSVPADALPSSSDASDQAAT